MIHNTVGDPLVDEVRAIREAISNENGNDVARLCEDLRRLQVQYADRIAPLSPRAMVTPTKATRRTAVK